MANQHERINSIYHPKNCKLAIIREEYEAICKEAPNSCCAAVLLNVVEYWTGRPKAKEDGWVYRSYGEMCKDIMRLFSPDTIGVNMNWLVDYGYVYRRNNPKHKFDKKYQYLLNVELINNAISNWESSTLQRKRKNRTSVDENHLNEYTGNQSAIQENKKENKRDSFSTEVRKESSSNLDVTNNGGVSDEIRDTNERSPKQREIDEWVIGILCALGNDYLWDEKQTHQNPELGRYYSTAKRLRDIANAFLEKHPDADVTPEVLQRYWGKNGSYNGWIRDRLPDNSKPGLEAMVNYFSEYLSYAKKPRIKRQSQPPVSSSSPDRKPSNAELRRERFKKQLRKRQEKRDTKTDEQ